MYVYPAILQRRLSCNRPDTETYLLGLLHHRWQRQKEVPTNLEPTERPWCSFMKPERHFSWFNRPKIETPKQGYAVPWHEVPSLRKAQEGKKTPLVDGEGLLDGVRTHSTPGYRTGARGVLGLLLGPHRGIIGRYWGIIGFYRLLHPVC